MGTGFVIIGYYLRNTSQTKLIGPFVIAIVIVLVGLFYLIITTLMYVLYRNKRYTNQHVIRIFGVLYLQYRAKIGWWNSVNLLRFHTVGGAVGFFLGWGAVQLSLLLLIFVAYVILLVLFRPYKQRTGTLVDLVFSLFIILILVLLFVVWGLEDGTSMEWILRVVIWLFWLAILAYFVFIIIYLFFVFVFWFVKRRNFQSDEERKLWDERYFLYGPGGLHSSSKQKDHSSSEDRLL